MSNDVEGGAGKKKNPRGYLNLRRGWPKNKFPTEDLNLQEI